MAAFIASQREAHGAPHAVSCRALGVSQSWSCKWGDGTLPLRAARRQRLKAEVARLFQQREGKEGAPRVAAALRKDGWKASGNTVAALMREQGLAARRPKRRKGTTRPGRGRWRAEDLVRRKFAAGGINRRWYGDGTEVKTAEGKLYLDSALAYGALAMAVAVRGGSVPGVIFHTGQGSEYTARSFRAACERLGIAQSMGRPGSALDNAVTESWHSTLEFELRSLRQFAAKAEARTAVAAWIEDYSHVRRHSALGMRSPVDYERSLAGKDAA